MSSNEEKWEEHPSYGTVQFNRVYRAGRCTLFGSSITNHQTSILLTLRQAKRSHHLHQDSIYGHTNLIEVELSSAQFAELLTTMNVNTGVPCTIRYIRGTGDIPKPPDVKVEVDRVQDSFKEEMKELTESIHSRRKMLVEILEKKSLGKEDRKTILGICDRILQDLESNVPFIIDQFNEATGRVVSTAKAEVDAFVTGVVIATGLQRLNELKSEIKAIEPPKEE